MNKIKAFIEDNVEKIVLIAVGIVCLWLLVTRVILSPNAVPLEDRKFTPGSLDKYVYTRAEDLQTRLGQAPSQVPPYKPVAGEYIAKLQSSISGIDASLWPTVPFAVASGSGSERKYLLPQIGDIKDVAVEHIRAVAYVPTEKVSAQRPYENAAHEANDVDLVTVEGRFDVTGLYASFREIFLGDDVPPEWRDPCLARPVFASVQLQRQELKDDGSWSGWEVVPRSRIEHYGEMFEAIDDLQQLPPGGLKVQLLQFDNRDVQRELLQPKAYQIASPNEEWFPPMLHRKYVTLQAEEQREEKRKAQEEKAKQERDDQSDLRRPKRTDTRTRLSGPAASGSAAYDTAGVLDELYGGRDSRTRANRTDRRTDSRYQTDSTLPSDRNRRSRVRGRDERDTEANILAKLKETAKKPSTDDVYTEFYEIQIDPRTDMSKRKELLAFWAHDDTVNPGKTYRYRMRLGVFNPVAGTGQLSGKADASLKGNVILWSNFSEVTEAVDIPRMLYFFAKGIQEAVKTVDVQVSRYVLGHWYSKDFPGVSQGEAIGRVVENEPAKKKKPLPSFGGRPIGPVSPPDEATEPEAIDYSTGAIMVDAVPVSDWSGENRYYYDMLYSYDGNRIEHMPIKSQLWEADLRNAFAAIGKLAGEPKEPLRAWNSAPARRIRKSLDYTGMGEYDALMEEEILMMQQRTGR